MRPFASKRHGEMAVAERRRRLRHGGLSVGASPRRPARRDHAAQRPRSFDGSQPRGVRAVGGRPVGRRLERRVELPAGGDGCEVWQHAFGQGGQVRRADRRGLRFGRSLHGHAELVGLELQQVVHHRRATVDPQLAQRAATGLHHRVDRITGLERHRLDDGPGEVAARRAAGDADDRARGRRDPTTASRAR